MKCYIRKHYRKSTNFFLFQVWDFNISNIFYKSQNFNGWSVSPVITHWTYTCLSPWALKIKSGLKSIDFRHVFYLDNVSIDANVGVEFLATTLADKHMANVLPNYMLVMHWERLAILFRDIAEVNPVSLCLSREAFSSLKGISTGFAGEWW